MNNAGRIREALTGAHNLTGYEGEGGAGAAVTRALRELLAAARLDEEIDGLAAQLGDIDNLLGDFNRQLLDCLTGLEFDRARFLACENRLNQLNHLKGKYRAGLAEIIEQGTEKKERAAVLNDYENYRLGLAQKQAERREQALGYCRRISAIRAQLAADLQDKMAAALRDLNFPHVRFAALVKSDEAALGAEGCDEVAFMIAPNLGEEMRPLNQIASGGELSRIMLALKTIKAGQEEKETLIFDEIDAGISGKTAWKVAERLGLLARERQVICITHLPQIAAMADSHFAIAKDIAGGRTVTGISCLAEAESIGELARLLGAENVTEAGLTNAAELRQEALAFKNGK
jgi:DNA repair protein RecN (Recombination protein N)